MPQLQPELTFRALSLLLIVFLALILVVLSMISMWKENRFGWPLRGIIWFTVAIVGSCAVIALLAGYVQKARSLEKVTQRVEAVTGLSALLFKL
jgi:predicted ferric reductase